MILYHKKTMENRQFKKILSLILTLSILFTTINIDIFADSQYIQISSQSDLRGMNGDNKYILTNDIELSDNWESIESFSGQLDGNGHTITSNGQSLFYEITNTGIVKNIIIKGKIKENKEDIYYGGLTSKLLGKVLNSLIDIELELSRKSQNYIGTIAGELSEYAVEGTVVDNVVAIARLNFIDEKNQDEGEEESKDEEDEGYESIPEYLGGLVGYIVSESSYVENSYWSGIENSSYDDEYVRNSNKIEEGNQNTQDFADKLNSNLKEGYLSWAIDDSGNLRLSKTTSDNQDSDNPREELQKLSEKIDSLKESLYEKADIDKIKEENQKAKELLEDESTDKETLKQSLENLKNLFDNLRKIQINKEELKNIVDEYKSIDLYLYKKSSIEKLNKEIELAEQLIQSDESSQDEVDNSKTKLQEVFGQMQKRNTTGFDISSYTGEIIPVRTANDIKNIQSGKIYRLENDIKLKESIFRQDSLDIIFDGNGHTIEFEKNIFFPLFYILEEDSIIQNLGVKGNIEYYDYIGGIASVNRGLIINSYSNANITAYNSISGGLVGNLDYGSIVNSYATGEIGKSSSGGLAGKSNNGLILNSYWDSKYQNAVSSGSVSIKNSISKTLKDIKSKEFIDLLNSNTNAYLKQWGREKDSSLPYHGQDNEPIAKIEEEFLYPVKFTDILGNETVLTKKGIITVNAVLGDKDFHIGQMELLNSNLKEGQIEWYNSDLNAKNIQVGFQTGKVFSHGEDKITVEVFDLSSGKKEKIAEFDLVSQNPEVEDLKVFVADEHSNVNIDSLENLAQKEYVFDGKQYKEIILKAKLKGNTSYIDVNEYNFTYKEENKNPNFSINRSEFTFNEPGRTKLNISLGDFKTHIDLESKYVPVESIKPVGGKYIIHLRNTMSQNFGFIPLTGTGTLIGKGKQVVEVEPKNASYKDKWEIISSDDTIAKYVPYIIVSVVPYKAGTVELTAISKDPYLKQKVSGKSILEIEYKNPVKEIRLESKTINIKEDEEKELGMEIIGSNDEEEHVSEPEIEWTYEGSGRVKIATKNKAIDQGIEKGYVADDKYFIKGISSGKVRATGVLRDKTNPIEPIIIDINVSANENAEKTDLDLLSKKGLDKGKAYISSKYENKSFEFGDEWVVLTLSRIEEIKDEYIKQNYIESVNQAFSPNNEFYKINQKPTTIARTILGLGSLGIDAQKISQYDFIEKLLNNSSIQDGSNEAIFALIAIDSKPYDDKGYKYNREQLIDEILKYQNSQTGGFGLNSNSSTGIDMTAMALQSLARYKENSKVKTAIDKGLKYLKDNLNSSFGYDSVESTAQVLLALSTLNIDPLKEENGFFVNDRVNIITALMSFYSEEEGGFKHKISDKSAQLMSTLQATYSLEAYKRFKLDKKPLYDFSDISFGKENSNNQDIKIYKDHLQNLIDKAREKLNSKQNYEKETFDILEKAVNDAQSIINDKESTKQSLQEQIDLLKKSINGLKIISGSSDLEQDKKQINLYFTLKGMSIQGDDEQVWISRKEARLQENSKVFDLFDKMLKDNNIQYKIRDEASGGYVYSIKSPIENEWLSEFTNGKYSGWMYTVNGVYPPYGLKAYTLNDNDEVVWHYTNDYRKNHSFSASGGNSENTSVSKPKMNINKENIANIIADDKFKKSIELSIENAKKNSEKSVIIDMRTDEKISGIKLELAKEIVSKLSNETDIALDIKSNLINMRFDKKAMDVISNHQKKSNSDIIVISQEIKDISQKLGKQDDKKLNTIQAILENRPVFDISLILDNQHISDYKDGQITVEIPYKLNGEKADELTVYRIEADASLVEIKDSYYDNKKEMMVFKTNHLSIYSIGTKQIKKEVQKEDETQPYFIDINEGLWYAKAVNELAKRQIIKGKEENKFYPNDNITRAEFVTILANLSNEEIVANKESVFKDVNAHNWHYKYIVWANDKQIVKGYNNEFKPNANITRQEMALILLNYINYKKDIKLSQKSNDLSFKDEDEISSWARESVKIMSENGIIKGTDKKEFQPKENATRAQASQLIYNVINY